MTEPKPSTARRDFLRQAAAGAGALLSSSLPRAAHGAAPPRSGRPNILFIMTDQQHAGMLSCVGNAYVKTPAMDSLAQSGFRFERAYCANPVCMPSRFAMLTGAMPSRVALEENRPGVKVPPALLEHALGHVFRSAGYEAVYGGKIHTPMSLADMGFDDLTRDERAGLADACAQFLRREHDRPFLLVASFINPHDICYMAIRDWQQKTGTAGPERDRPNPPPPIRELDAALQPPPGVSREEFLTKHCPPLPANLEVPEGEPEAILASDPRPFRFHAREKWSDDMWRLHRWAYARLTEKVDSEVAVVLQALRDAGLEETTAIVFTSDHGDMDAAHRLEHKSVLYEEAARVPLIVSWEGVIKPGRVDDKHLVSTGLDLIPTLCDMAGIPIPPQLHGHSVQPLAEGRSVGSWRDCLVVETLGSRLVRTARYKYMAHATGAHREHLVDLERDPGEMRNVAADPRYRKVLLAHRRRLVEWCRQHGEQLDPQYVVTE